MIENHQLVIVMGAARSGTTWLQAMLAAHDTICTVSEPFLFHYTTQWLAQWDNQNKSNQHGVKVGLPTLWSRDDMLAYLREFLARVYGQVTEQHPGTTILVDKTPSYTRHVAHIHELVPDAHFIHIVRDGRDVVASTLAASKSWGKFWASGNAARVAEQWAKSVLAGRGAAQTETHYHEVRYEDLLANGPQALQGVFEAIGLSVEPEHIQRIYDDHHIDNMRQRYTSDGGAQQSMSQRAPGVFVTPKAFYRRGTAMGWMDDLSPLQRYSVFRAAQPLLLELGYAQDDAWWYETPFQQRVIPAIVQVQRLFSPVLGMLRYRIGTLRRKLMARVGRAPRS